MFCPSRVQFYQISLKLWTPRREILNFQLFWNNFVGAKNTTLTQAVKLCYLWDFSSRQLKSVLVTKAFNKVPKDTN